MPKPPKRPRDTMQLAKFIGDIAASERAGDTDPAPDAAAVKRGKARAASLTPAKRKKIAKKAARARWEGTGAPKGSRGAK